MNQWSRSGKEKTGKKLDRRQKIEKWGKSWAVWNQPFTIITCFFMVVKSILGPSSAALTTRKWSNIESQNNSSCFGDKSWSLHYLSQVEEFKRSGMVANELGGQGSPPASLTTAGLATLSVLMRVPSWRDWCCIIVALRISNMGWDHENALKEEWQKGKGNITHLKGETLSSTIVLPSSPSMPMWSLSFLCHYKIFPIHYANNCKTIDGK